MSNVIEHVPSPVELLAECPRILKKSSVRIKLTPNARSSVHKPILMNLFMHYAFDTWMQRTSPNCPFAQNADDAVVHRHSWKQTEYVMRSIATRLTGCGLRMHPEKSKIVYCKDSNRTYSNGVS